MLDHIMAAKIGEDRGEGPRPDEEPADHGGRFRRQEDRFLDFCPGQRPVEDGKDQPAKRPHRGGLGRCRQPTKDGTKNGRNQQGQRHKGNQQVEIDFRHRRHILGARLWRQFWLHEDPDDDVDNVKTGQKQAREHRRRIQAQRRQLGDRGIDDQHDRGRDQDAKRTSSTDHARCELLVIVGRRHRRKGQQTHQRHHRADDTGRGREHGTGDQRGDGHRPGQIAGRHLQRMEQPVDDVGALDDIAHEQEQRNGNQRVVLHHRIGVLVQKIENVVVEDVGNGLDPALIIGVIAEADPHGEQGKGDREAQQHKEDEHAEHQNGDLWISHRALLSNGECGGHGRQSWPSGPIHQGVFGFPDIIDALHPDTGPDGVPATEQFGKALQNL